MYFKHKHTKIDLLEKRSWKREFISNNSFNSSHWLVFTIVCNCVLSLHNSFNICNNPLHSCHFSINTFLKTAWNVCKNLWKNVLCNWMCLGIHLLQYQWNHFSRQLKDIFLNLSFNFPTQKIIPEIDKPKETSL